MTFPSFVNQMQVLRFRMLGKVSLPLNACRTGFHLVPKGNPHVTQPNLADLR